MQRSVGALAEISGAFCAGCLAEHIGKANDLEFDLHHLYAKRLRNHGLSRESWQASSIPLHVRRGSVAQVSTSHS